MDKFGEHLRGQCKSIASGDKCGDFRARGLMAGMLDNFGSN